MKIYIGIDPGKSGGIAFIPERGEPWVVKMPETERDLFDTLEIAPDWEPFAYLELVSAGLYSGKQGKMGSTSAFSFGKGIGSLKMALIATGTPFEEVTPGVWQRAMKCLTKGDKNVSKRRAQELFPQIKVTHAIADALLIAEFCRRTKRV